MIPQYGGRYLTKGGGPRTPEGGHWKPERVVVIEFPDVSRWMRGTPRMNTSL